MNSLESNNTPTYSNIPLIARETQLNIIVSLFISSKNTITNLILVAVQNHEFGTRN
jgi:hypothetical protein